MGIFSFRSYALCQTLLLLSVLSLPANASQIWEGAGRVISGVGEGGSVDLRLEIDGETVRSLLTQDCLANYELQAAPFSSKARHRDDRWTECQSPHCYLYGSY